jgi:site-specific recombinase XerD
MNLSKFIGLFIDYLLNQTNKPSDVTVKNYKADIAQFIRWYETRYKELFSPENVSLLTLNEYKADRLNPSKEQNKVSVRSIDRHFSSLRKFFNFLKLDGYIPHSPFESETHPIQPEADKYGLKDFKDYLYVYNASHLTIKNYIIDVKQFVSWAEEVTGVENEWDMSKKDLFSKIDNSVIEEYKKRLVANSFSPLTVNRKLSSLRRYLTWAASEGLITKQPEVLNVKSESPSGIEQLASNYHLPDSTDKQQISDKSYSGFAPVRLFQKIGRAGGVLFDAIITSPLSVVSEKASYLNWKRKGRPVFRSMKPEDRRWKSESLKSRFSRNQEFKIQPLTSNIKKISYAPLSVSVANYPWYKKAVYHARYTRPNWYKKYHSYSITTYFHLAILVVFMAGLGFGIYDAFFVAPRQQQPALAALPTAPPRILSFQGRLTDINDNPITATTPLRFIIYNNQSASGSARLWEEIDTVSPDGDGIFSIYLGNNTAIPDTLFSQNAALWLGVTVQWTPELTPRQQLATVAYAANSETLQGLLPITSGSAGQTDVVLALNSSGNLTIGGSANPVFQATGGQFTLSGNILVLTTTAGSNGNVKIIPDGMGTIDLQKPLQNTTNTNNISTAVGAVEIDDLFAVLATSSGQSAFTINQNGAGPIISASASGNAKFTVGNDGTVTSGNLLSLAANTYSIGSSTNYWNNLYVNNIYSGGAIIANYWQRNAGAIAPLNITDDLLLGASSTTSAIFSVTGIASNQPTASTSGNLIVMPRVGWGGRMGIGTINPLTTLDIVGSSSLSANMSLRGATTAHTFNILDNGTLNIQRGPGGDTSLTSVMFIQNNGNVGIANTNPGALLDIGTAGSTLGTMRLEGNTSGYVQIQPLAAAGSWTMTLPGTGGTSNYVLSTDGSGTTSWSDPSTLAGGTNLWQQTSGALYPKNSTVDLLIGGYASSSAVFSVLGLSYSNHQTTASVSGNLVVMPNNGNGGNASISGSLVLGAFIPSSIQTTSNQILTIGGSTTGNIILYPRNGSGYVGIDTTTPGAALDVNGNLLVNGGGSIDVRSAGTLTIGGATQTGLTLGRSGQNTTIANLTVTGGVVYTNGSGLLSQVVSGSVSSQCLLGGNGTTPAWGSCATGTSDTYWITASGAIYPINPTYDFLIGGTASSSAVFGVLGLSYSNHQTTASVSGNLVVMPNNGNGGNASISGSLVLGALAASSIQTTSNQTLTIGGSTTGNIALSPLNGSGKITINGSLTTTGAITAPTSTNTINSLIINAGAISGVTTITSTYLNTAASYVDLVSSSELRVGGTAVISSGRAIQNATAITSSGTITFSGLSINGGVVYTTGTGGQLAQTAAGGATQCLLGGTPPVWGSCATGTSDQYWTSASGAMYPWNPTYDFLLGGTASSSAVFGVLGLSYSNHQTTASVSGNLVVMPNNGNGGNASISGNLILGALATSSIQTTKNQTLTIGGSTTGNILLAPLNSAAGGYIAPSITNQVDLGTSTLTFRNIYAGTVYSGGVSVTNLWQRNSGAIAPLNITDDLLLGSGASSSALFSVTGIASNQPTASISGNLIIMPRVGWGGFVGIGNTSPLEKLDINGNATFSGNLTFSGARTIEGRGMNTLTLGGSQTGAVVIDSGNGVVKLADLTTSGGVLYVDSVGKLALATGWTGTQCLIGGTPPTWGSCGGANYWQLTTNSLAPANETYAFNVGNVASTSALFHAPGTTNNDAWFNLGTGGLSIGKTSLTSGYKLDAAGGIISSGSSAELALTDRNTVTNSWSFYSTSNILKIYKNFNTAKDVVAIDSSGNFGIGNTSPNSLLDVQGAPTGKALMNLNYTSTDQNILAASTSGVTKFYLTNAGSLYGASFYDLDNTSFYLDPAATGWSLSTYGSLAVGPNAAANGYTNGALYIEKNTVGKAAVTINQLSSATGADLIAASVSGTTNFLVQNSGNIVVGPGGTGKITATTYDPLYTIDGHRYSTYAPAMAGVKEEVTGKANLVYDQLKQAYSYTISLNNQPQASDLWVFSRVSDPDVSLTSVLLTPDSAASVWYQKDIATRTITLMSNLPTSVSYRFTAPRYDYQRWSNVSDIEDPNITGSFVPAMADLIQKQLQATLSAQPATDSASFTINTTIDSAGNTVYYLVDNFQNIINRTDSFMGLIVANIKAGAIKASEVTVDNLTVGGQNISSFIVSVVNNALSNGTIAPFGNENIISPIAKIDQIKTNIISPLASDASIEVALGNSVIEVRNTQTQKVVARIDDSGNASFAGQLASNSLAANEATIAGTLRAKKIIADDIEGFHVSAATVSANYITNNYYATESSDLTFAPISDGYINISSMSGQFIYVEGLQSKTATFTQGLMAFGPTSLSDTSITGQLSIDGNLILANGSINVLGADLELQPLRQGGISFLSGLVRIDESGNLSVAGDATFAKDVTVRGKLAAGIISPLPYQDLNIVNSSNSAVLSISQRGDVVASGSGTFGRLNLTLVAPAYALSDNEIIATGSAGIATISAKQKYLTIINRLVTDKSLIYITPVGSTNGQTPYLLRQIPGQSFTIGVDNKPNDPMPFNWLIIN